MSSFNFRLIYGLRVLQTGLKTLYCIQMSKTSELPGAPPSGSPPGALPLDPTRALWRAPGPHADLRSARYALTFLAPPLQKTFRGPCITITKDSGYHTPDTLGTLPDIAANARARK